MMDCLTRTQTLASLHGQEEKLYDACRCPDSGMLSESGKHPITTFITKTEFLLGLNLIFKWGLLKRRWLFWFSNVSLNVLTNKWDTLIFRVQEGASWVVKCLSLSAHWKAGGARSLYTLKRMWRMRHVQSRAQRWLKGPGRKGSQNC